MSNGRAMLEREADYFHVQFFRRPTPPVVLERYVRASQLCFPSLSERMCRMLEVIVERSLDVESIELFLRLRHHNRVLTRKIQMLFYLVEVRAAYCDDFVNRRPGVARAIVRLLTAGIGTAWKCAKGWYLVWVNDFV